MMGHYLTQVRRVPINKSNNHTGWRGCAEKGILLPWWWGCNWVRPPCKTLCRTLRKKSVELPQDPAIPLLGIDPDKARLEKDTGTRTLEFMAALCTRAHTWRPPTCPSRDEPRKKTSYLHGHDGPLRSQTKHKTMPAVAARAQLETLLLSEASHKDKDKCHVTSPASGI